LNQRLRKQVSAATARLENLGGQGVLVPGGFILTVAHCIEWDGTGGMALGDYCLERVKTRDGRKFRASVYAAEPVSDIAVLGPADSQEFGDDWDAFDAFAEAVKPIDLFNRVLDLNESIPVQVLTPRAGGLPAKPRGMEFPERCQAPDKK
jgi:hypothetical protein